jgi:glycerophosphoryl diester phosphodiesterase
MTTTEVFFTALFERADPASELHLVLSVDSASEPREHLMRSSAAADNRMHLTLTLPRRARISARLCVKLGTETVHREAAARQFVVRGAEFHVNLGLPVGLVSAFGAFRLVDSVRAGSTHVRFQLGGVAAPEDASCLLNVPASVDDLPPNAELKSAVRLLDAAAVPVSIVVASDDADEKERRVSLADARFQPVVVPYTTPRPLARVHLSFQVFAAHNVLLGRAHITGSSLHAGDGFLHAPLIAGDAVVGELVLFFVVVQSYTARAGVDAAPRATVRSIWKTVPCEDVGHRGSGAHNARSSSNSHTWLDENTIHSFVHAAENELPFIEFDVQLSSDGVPVIWHDFVIKNEHGHKLSPYDLTLAQFKQLHVPQIERAKQAKHHEHDAGLLKRNLARWAGDTLKDTLTTLAEIFERTPEWLGFDVELKYPNLCELRDELVAANVSVHSPARNAFVDAVLDVVFAHAAQRRRIFFSTFDPELALLLHMKQTVYPVLFLTEAGVKQRAFDVRAATLEGSVRFACQANLAGLVSRVTPLLANHDLFALVKRADLLVGTFGWQNNDLDNVALQERHRVDFVVSDHIATFAARKPEMSRRAKLLAAEL